MPARKQSDPDGLSKREAQVLRLNAIGYGNNELAARLKLSVRTIESYKKLAMEKLGLKTRVQVVRYGIKR